MKHQAYVIAAKWDQATSDGQECGDCDCACATASMPTVSPHVPEFTDVPCVIQQPTWMSSLRDGYSAMWGPRLPLVVLHPQALPIIERFHTPTAPHAVAEAAPIVAQLMAAGVITPAGYPEAQLREDPPILAAWLHITDRCNLQCQYCYLPRKSQDMSLTTGKTAIGAVLRSANLNDFRSVKLKYSGGEALLRLPLVLDLHRYAQHMADARELALDGIVLTNGTLLTAAMLEQLQHAGLRLMISLDGIGAAHDCHRAYEDGQGSFEQVARAIDHALAIGMKPTISITVSSRNIDGLAEVVAWVLERDLPFSLNFYRENEQSVQQADLKLEDKRIIAGMLAAYRVIEAHLPRRSLLSSLIDRGNLAVPHLRTCSVGHNYLVFDTLGRVSQCQMRMQHPLTDSSAPDPLRVIRENTTGINNIRVDLKSECRDCQWRYYCGGGVHCKSIELQVTMTPARPIALFTKLFSPR